MGITRTKCPRCGQFTSKPHEAPYYVCQCGRAWSQKHRVAKAMLGTMPTLAGLAADARASLAPQMRDSDLILAICKAKGWGIEGYLEASPQAVQS